MQADVRKGDRSAEDVHNHEADGARDNARSKGRRGMRWQKNGLPASPAVLIFRPMVTRTGSAAAAWKGTGDLDEDGRRRAKMQKNLLNL